MRDISCEEAAASHGIVACHQEMNNGELRFRLMKSDGTGYIRTKSAPNGAWQKSHVHEQSAETYIVQQGWVAYAELITGQRRVRIYCEGESFTAEPDVVHNIYMPSNSVIHTVKHGKVVAEDRNTDGAIKLLDKVTESLTEDKILREARMTESADHPDQTTETYTTVYRHFDTLIWQVPAWSTAAFLVAVVGADAVSDATYLPVSSSFTGGTAAAAFIVLMSFVCLSFSYALYRFRWHQWRHTLLTRPKGLQKVRWWGSGSTCLQFVVTVQAFALIFLWLAMVGLDVWYALATCAVLILGTTIAMESHVRRPSTCSNGVA